MIRVEKKALFIIIYLFLISISIKSCQAIDGKEYSLQIKITTSCAIPYQSVSPIAVSVELSNMGNETFNGTLSIEGETTEGHYGAREYPISNLTKNVVNTFIYSVSTDYAGRYWFTVKIEEEHLSTIKLYQDSTLIEEGIRVQATSSIFLHSFTEFIAIVGIVVAAIVSIAGIVYSRKRSGAGSSSSMNVARAWILWVKGKITLERAWYLFAIAFVLFVIISVIYPDPFRVTFGISLLTIIMMYLIMISGNIELQRATQTQVKAFVEQLQAVGQELKNVGSELSGLINVMR